MLRGFRVRLSRPKMLVGGLLVLLVAAGAAGVGAPAGSAAPSAAAKEEPPCAPLTEFDADNFSDPTTIDNEFLPLIPGTRTVLEGRADRGGGALPHQVIFVVTDVTKVINGVRTVAVWDRDINEGVLAEEELAFFAQDDDGNVWLMGEYPEEWEEGKFSAAPDVWFSGIQGAKAGIMMRADPKLGTTSYYQGLAPEIEFADKAKVHQMGLRTCVPLGCYDDVMVTDEWNALDKADAHQRKFYAPGVGNIRVGFAGGTEQEELVLVKLSHLDTGELAQAREEALKLEQRAYRVRKDVYGPTQPAEHTP